MVIYTSGTQFEKHHYKVSELQTHPNLHSPDWVERNDRSNAPKSVASHRGNTSHMSAAAEGQQQRLKTTSDVTSKFPWCCRTSVLWSGKVALDVASDDPPDEALSCRRRAWDVP